MITSLWRRPAAQQPDEFDVAWRDRMRQIASCLVLCAITFLTGPTKIISDTKIDMALDPGAFLTRALHMWDPAQFGQIQNQAYGYLFPMGPFYVLGEAAGLPAWIVQRLWLSLVLVVAFMGAVKLAGALRIGTPATRLVAAFAFALAPHAQVLVGVNSSEFWPTAVLPWIVLPLVKGVREGYGPRRAAAWSALAVFACGGINAAAEAAVLVVPALYLLTRQRGPRRRRLMTWWVVFTAFATFWWAVPLLLMGGYGFNFLPFTESAEATTGVTSLTNILRGVEDWVGFVPVDGRPWWPAGYEHATAVWLIVATAVVAGLGMTGLVLRRLNERTFLLITLLVGVAIMASGHVSDVSSPLAPGIRELFNGVLAALRNLHKFDVLVRLPICLGIAHLLTRPFNVPRLPRLRPAFAVGVTVVLAVTMLPVATAGLAARGGFTEVPGYWKQATSWLNKHTGDQAVLAVPGARWGEYTWGRPLDEPMQAELHVRWASRQIVPWGSDGMARLLEGIDDRMTSGRGSPGLADVLRRMGVKYLLVRNDLDRNTLRGAWPPRVHQALDNSPGLKRVTYFGGLVGSADTGDATTWFDQPYPALEIYQVADAAPIAETVSSAKPLRVTGGPESLLTLADAGLLQGDRPVIFDDDPGASSIPASQTIDTDSLRKREVKFSDMRQAASPTLTKDEKFKGTGPARDTTEPDWSKYTATARYNGVTAITASSSASDITAPADGRSSGLFPYSAFDGDTRTAWESAGWDGPVGEWIQAKFASPLPVRTIAVSFLQNDAVGPPVSQVEITTQKGTVRQKVAATGAPQVLNVKPGTTNMLKIRVTKVAWQPRSKVGSKVGISEITVPGLLTGRTIVTPPATSSKTKTNPTVALATDPEATPGCMLGSHTWTCSGLLQNTGEDGNGFDRTFTQNSRQTRVVRGSAVLTDQDLVNKLTTLPKVYPQVTASSTMLDQPQLLGRSAFDGDPRTTWIPSSWDPNPSLDVKLGHKTRIDRLQVKTASGGMGGPPVQVSMLANGQVRGGWAGADGWIAFPPVTADHLVLQFKPMSTQALQVTDITIPGVRPIGPPPAFALKSLCGLGPTLLIDGYPIKTKITGGTMADLLAGRAVSYQTCQKVTVVRGQNRITASRTDPYQLQTAIVGPGKRELLPDSDTRAEPVPIGLWGPAEREVHVSTDGPGYLVVNENFNKGWQATMDGRRLRAVRLDGWRQAWVIPDEAYSPVTITYGPDLPYRASLLLGLILVLIVALAAVTRVAPGRAVLRLPSLPPGRVGRTAVWIGTAALGFWTAGIYGVVMILVSLLLIGRARRLLERGGLPPAVYGFSRALASSWFPAVFMTAAGLCMSVGTQLQMDERFDLSGPMRDVAAQMLCLPVLGALAAALSRFAVPRHGDPLAWDEAMTAGVAEAEAPAVRKPEPVWEPEPVREPEPVPEPVPVREPVPDPVASEGEPEPAVPGGEPDAASVLGLTEEDMADLAEPGEPARTPRFAWRRRRRRNAEQTMTNDTEPVAPERPAAAAAAPESNGNGAAPLRPGWFDQPERPAEMEAPIRPRRFVAPERPADDPEPPKPSNGHAGAKRPGWFEEPQRGEQPPEPMPGPPDGNDQLVATLNHGGWGPPPAPEATGPLDSVDGPPQAQRTDEPGDR